MSDRPSSLRYKAFVKSFFCAAILALSLLTNQKASCAKEEAAESVESGENSEHVALIIKEYNDAAARLHQSGRTIGAGYKHPVLPVKQEALSKQGAKFKKEADRILAETPEAEWANLVPRQSPRSSIGSPEPGFERTGAVHWKWDFHHPDQITNEQTKVTFPNDRYPTKQIAVEVLSGKTVQVPYCTSADGKGKFFIDAQINHEKREFLCQQLAVLADAYTATGNEKYARPIAIALLEWANVNPDYYLSTGQNNPAPSSPKEVKASKNIFMQRASDHNGFAHEIMGASVVAFDRIYDSQALKDFSREKGFDVREKISRDLFMNMADYFVDFIPLDHLLLTNLGGAYDACVRIGVILKNYKIIDWASAYLSGTLMQRYTRDFHTPESPQYSGMIAATNRNLALALDYFFKLYDPETPAQQKSKDLVAKQIRMLDRDCLGSASLPFPNMDSAPYGDTHLHPGNPRSQTTSGLMPAWGLAALGSGSNEQQSQVDIGFIDYANHIHFDLLSLAMYAFGHELMSDLRYHREAGRHFSSSTVSHNTVIVNRQNQNQVNGQLISSKLEWGNVGHLFLGGNVNYFEPGLAGISAIEVSCPWAYPTITSRYQRTLIYNSVDPAHPYLVDVFRVVGGSTHDYALYGSTQFDQKYTTSLPLEKMQGPYPMLAEGEKWQEPKVMGSAFPLYGVFREMSTAKPHGNPWSAAFLDAASGTYGYRVVIPNDLNDPGSSKTVFLGNSPCPSMRMVNGKLVKAKGLSDWWRPVLLVRREGENGLESTFAGVIEPLHGAPSVVSVKQVPLKTPNAEHLALVVTLSDGREDTYFVNLTLPGPDGTATGPELATADGSASLQGKVGVVSRSKGGGEKLWMIDGERLTSGKHALTQGPARYSGSICEAIRTETGGKGNALITDVDLPVGTVLRGKWLALTFGTCNVIPAEDGTYPAGIKTQEGLRSLYLIDRVEKKDGKTSIYMVDDHGLSIAGGQTVEQLCPSRIFNGAPHFEIMLSKTL